MYHIWSKLRAAVSSQFLTSENMAATLRNRGFKSASWMANPHATMRYEPRNGTWSHLAHAMHNGAKSFQSETTQLTLPIVVN